MVSSQYRFYNRSDLFEMLVNGNLDLDLAFAEQDYWIKTKYWHVCKVTDLRTNRKAVCIILSAKRGTKKYAKMVLRRIREHFSRFKDKDFFSYGVDGSVYSHVLKGNLQFDGNVFGDYFVDTWVEFVSYSLNRWLSVLRSNFGIVAYLRTFETHLSGLPHIHFVLYFPNHTFKGYLDSKTHKYRVSGKDYDILKDCWLMGYSNYEMVSNLSSAVKYIYKYVAKACDRASIEKISDNDTYMKLRLTLFYNWVFGKRSFDISKMKYFRLPVVPSTLGVFSSNDENVNYSSSNSESSNLSNSPVSGNEDCENYIFGFKEFKKRKDKRFKFEKLGSMILDYSILSGRSFGSVNLDWFDVSIIKIKKYRIPNTDRFVSRNEYISILGIDYGCINVDSLYECTYDGIRVDDRIKDFKIEEINVYSLKPIVDCKCIVDGSFCHKDKCNLCKDLSDHSQKKMMVFI